MVGPLAAAAASAVAFAAWERRSARPMFPTRLLRSAAFSAGNVAIFAVNAALTGVIFLMPQFQQVVAVAGPGVGYPALLTPTIIIGLGLALAIPAVTRSVTGTAAPADIGTASGAFSTMRQLGGAFGVAVLGAVFAATGSYATAAAFSHGFSAACYTAAGLAVAGAVAGTVLPGRANRPAPAGLPQAGSRSGVGEVAAGR